MLEWLMRHAWKACVPLKGTAGSNPAFSAKEYLSENELQLVAQKQKKARIKLV